MDPLGWSSAGKSTSLACRKPWSEPPAPQKSRRGRADLSAYLGVGWSDCKFKVIFNKSKSGASLGYWGPTSKEKKENTLKKFREDMFILMKTLGKARFPVLSEVMWRQSRNFFLDFKAGSILFSSVCLLMPSFPCRQCRWFSHMTCLWKSSFLPLCLYFQSLEVQESTFDLYSVFHLVASRWLGT